MRVLHLSDIHVTVPLLRIPRTEWIGKRALAGANLVIRGRGRRFARAIEKLKRMVAFNEGRPADLVILSGDYTAMGTELEFLAARAAVEPLMGAPLGFVTLPGNHDLYVRSVVRAERFERIFRDVLATDLPEFAVDGPWPLVRLVDDDTAVVCVNSARPDLLLRSAGRIPEIQLEALERLCRDERVRSRFVFLVTHYAVRLADGGYDTANHGLHNADEFLAAASRLERGVLLSGHVHQRFHLRIPDWPLDVFCAGSATIENREGFWIYERDAEGRWRAVPGRWNGSDYELEESSIPIGDAVTPRR